MPPDSQGVDILVRADQQRKMSGGNKFCEFKETEGGSYSVGCRVVVLMGTVVGIRAKP